MRSDRLRLIIFKNFDFFVSFLEITFTVERGFKELNNKKSNKSLNSKETQKRTDYTLKTDEIGQDTLIYFGLQRKGASMKIKLWKLRQYQLSDYLMSIVYIPFWWRHSMVVAWSQRNMKMLFLIDAYLFEICKQKYWPHFSHFEITPPPEVFLFLLFLRIHSFCVQQKKRTIF